ncbi:MAG TPA: ATP-binding protein [Anaerolineales bacterium]
MTAACHEVLDGRAGLVTLWGSSGNGKSAALIATLNEFLDRGYSGLYIPAYDLLNYLQDAFHSDEESVQDRLEKFKKVDLLAIDELQAVSATGWRLEQIRNLIDFRWRKGLEGGVWTLVAMNEDPGELEPRIASRLRDGRNRLDGPPVIHNRDADLRPLLER